MSKFGTYGKFTAQPGKRDALVQALLEAAAALQSFEGCELYIVNVSESEPDVVWVTEVWRDQAAHQASLTPLETKAMIQRTMPLIAGVEQTRIVPVGRASRMPQSAADDGKGITHGTAEHVKCSAVFFSSRY